MNGAFEVGAIALRSQQKALDTVANNIANVNTPTFKRSDVRFSEIVAMNASAVSAVDELASRASSQAGGVRASASQSWDQPGALRQTDNPLDLAVDGKGFIELIGPGGQTLLWRGGSLMVSEDGLLATREGYVLQALISVPDDAVDLAIASDGVVSIKSATDDVIEVGQISLVRADPGAELERLDGSMYRAGLDTRMTDARAGEDGMGMLAQGRIEDSNVDLSAEMVNLLMIQRAFAASAQIVQAADQMASITNNLKR